MGLFLRRACNSSLEYNQCREGLIDGTYFDSIGASVASIAEKYTKKQTCHVFSVCSGNARN